MLAPNAKPVERPPTGPRLPHGWHAMHNFGIPYRPRDKPVQEDWESVARKFDVGVKELIYFNFMTDDPDEMNWYLHHYTGCNKASPSGNNWMFSNSANPGTIFIPPSEDSHVQFRPEKICVWMPEDVKKFMLRLNAVAQGMSGHNGERIKKLVKLIVRVGYPGIRNLWHYNDMNIKVYVDWKTDNAKRREMTKSTREVFPFDGLSGLYAQSGSEEQHRGYWRIHAVNDLFDKFRCGLWDVSAMKDDLERIDAAMYAGWHEMDLVEAKGSQGGGSAFGPKVYEFIDHVRFLTRDDNHMYSMFRP